MLGLAQAMAPRLAECGLVTTVEPSAAVLELEAPPATDFLVVLDEQEPGTRVLDHTMALFSNETACRGFIYDYSDLDEFFLTHHLDTLCGPSRVQVVRTQVTQEHWRLLQGCPSFRLGPFPTHKIHACPPIVPVAQRHPSAVFRGTIWTSTTDTDRFGKLRTAALDQVRVVVGESGLVVHGDQFLPAHEYLEEMRRHVCCVCPTGVSNMTWRLLEACANGCIPIVFDPQAPDRNYYDDLLDDTNSFRLPARAEHLRAMWRDLAGLEEMSRACREMFHRHNAAPAFAQFLARLLTTSAADG